MLGPPGKNQPPRLSLAKKYFAGGRCLSAALKLLRTGDQVPPRCGDRGWVSSGDRWVRRRALDGKSEQAAGHLSRPQRGKVELGLDAIHVRRGEAAYGY